MSGETCDTSGGSILSFIYRSVGASLTAPADREAEERLPELVVVHVGGDGDGDIAEPVEAPLRLAAERPRYLPCAPDVSASECPSRPEGGRGEGFPEGVAQLEELSTLDAECKPVSDQMLEVELASLARGRDDAARGGRKRQFDPFRNAGVRSRMNSAANDPNDREIAPFTLNR